MGLYAVFTRVRHPLTPVICRPCYSIFREGCGEIAMMDLFCLLIAAVFFGLTFAMICGLDRLLKKG